MALLASCSLALTYPHGGEERLACADGMDQDLDGLVDCADPDCDGQCPEQDAVACADGRDQDGDGLVDARDPQCWPGHSVTLSPDACVSVAGTTYQPAAALDRISSTAPVQVARVDFGAAGIGDAFVVTGSGLLSSRELLSGAVEASSFEALLDLTAAPTTTVRIGIAPAGPTTDPRTPTAGGLFFVIEPSGDVSIRMGRQSLTLWARWSRRLRVSLSIFMGEIHVALDSSPARFGPTGSQLQADIAALPAGEPLRFIVEMTGGAADERVAVGNISVMRSRYDPCGVEIPSPSEPRILGLVAMPDASLCAIGAAGSRRSTDDGATWSAGGAIAARQPVTAVSALLEPDGRALAALVVARTGADADVLDVQLASSTDCVHWTVEDTGLGRLLPSRLAPNSLGLVRDGDATRVTLIQRDPPASLLYVRAAAGAPWLNEPPVDLSGAFLDSLAAGIHIQGVVGNELATLATRRGVETFVRLDAHWAPLAAPIVVPSGVVGRLDEGHVEATAIAPRPSPNGSTRVFVAYGGGPIGLCPICSDPTTLTFADLAPRE